MPQWTEIKRSQRQISELIMADMTDMTDMTDRLKYVLQSGKRMRSMIALATQGASACLAAEYHHTLSILSREEDLVRGSPHATKVYQPRSISHLSAILAMKACRHDPNIPVSHMPLMCQDRLTELSPRERKTELLRYIKDECRLFQYCFNNADIGDLFGHCYILAGLINSNISNLIKSCFTRNELIDVFTEHIESYARIMTETQQWTPVLRELYSYVLLNFKKGIKSWLN